MIPADLGARAHALVDRVALGHIGSSAFRVCRQAAVINVDTVPDKRVSRGYDVDSGRTTQRRSAQIDGSGGC
jgi:hypothetical protein